MATNTMLHSDKLVEMAQMRAIEGAAYLKLPRQSKPTAHHARRYRHGMKNKACHNATHHG